MSGTRRNFQGDIEMLTANSLARNADVPIHTVRHYTRIGLLKPARHPSNNYKIYNFSDQTRLRFIISAKELGFTLAEVAQILDEAQSGDSLCSSAREIIKKHIAENKRKIESLKKLQKKMLKAQANWSSMKDKLPNGESVCHLIESVAEI